MNAFDPQVLAADLAEVRKIFVSFFSARTQADWEQHTEKSGKGWTLRETVAHLDAVGLAYQDAITSALAGKPYQVRGMTKRTDLPLWNQQEIEARSHIPLSEICDSFLNTLQEAEELVTRIDPTALTQAIAVPYYQRPITIGELFGAQASHPGLVHAAQVANGAGVKPLWEQFTPEMLSRQITRFLHIMSLAYWPERGGALQTAIELSAGGPGGGTWYLTITPEGSKSGEGIHPQHTLKIWFRNTRVLCQTFTLQISPMRSFITAQAFAWGDLRLASRMGWLFNPA